MSLRSRFWRRNHSNVSSWRTTNETTVGCTKRPNSRETARLALHLNTSIIRIGQWSHLQPSHFWPSLSSILMLWSEKWGRERPSPSCRMWRVQGSVVRILRALRWTAWSRSVTSNHRTKGHYSATSSVMRGSRYWSRSFSLDTQREVQLWTPLQGPRLRIR